MDNRLEDELGVGLGGWSLRSEDVGELFEILWFLFVFEAGSRHVSEGRFILVAVDFGIRL